MNPFKNYSVTFKPSTRLLKNFFFLQQLNPAITQEQLPNFSLGIDLQPFSPPRSNITTTTYMTVESVGTAASAPLLE
jgi:hypothetical protein